MARLLAITVFAPHASAVKRKPRQSRYSNQKGITVFARHASAVSENHGNSRNRGIYHQPWFNRGNFVAVKLPRTALRVLLCFFRCAAYHYGRKCKQYLGVHNNTATFLTFQDMNCTKPFEKLVWYIVPLRVCMCFTFYLSNEHVPYY